MWPSWDGMSPFSLHLSPRNPRRIRGRGDQADLPGAPSGNLRAHRWGLEPLGSRFIWEANMAVCIISYSTSSHMQLVRNAFSDHASLDAARPCMKYWLDPICAVSHRGFDKAFASTRGEKCAPSKTRRSRSGMDGQKHAGTACPARQGGLITPQFADRQKEWRGFNYRSMQTIMRKREIHRYKRISQLIGRPFHIQLPTYEMMFLDCHFSVRGARSHLINHWASVHGQGRSFCGIKDQFRLNNASSAHPLNTLLLVCLWSVPDFFNGAQ